MRVGKDLVAASSAPLVLGVLAEGDSYGYAIIQRVAELSRGDLEWSEGLLYPLLHRLERQGQVESSWGRAESGRRRRYYRLTRAGREALDEHRTQWRAVNDALTTMWDQMARVLAPVQLAWGK
ncbi:PadR family transcriptional regulator [Aestuariimicrobium ganziense]|uniref:PadR family transcriptional regulator n=1 Tax=Aestuariimicrobium ganziense TaxID=2773677 RepID=UPI0019406CC7|nr:PadR family transcriptional regulator [Aestuariimicrobium ganziense]